MTCLAFALVFAVGMALGFALCFWVERVPLFHPEYDSAPIEDTETEIPDEPVSDQFPVIHATDLGRGMP